MALALLTAHQPAANLWRVTKGFSEFDCDGNPADHDNAWKSVARYAYKVARLMETDKNFKELGDPKKPEGELSNEEDAEKGAEATISDVPGDGSWLTSRLMMPPAPLLHSR
jgi:hypothetical protein